MRSNTILLDDLGEVNLLYQYLYMSEDNYIMVSNTFAHLKIRMTDDFNFKCTNMHFPHLPELHYTSEMTLPNVLEMIAQLKQLPADNQVFPNKWEEIKTITRENLSLNMHILERL